MTKFSAGPIYKLKLDLHHLWLEGSLPATRFPREIDPTFKTPYAGGRNINLGPNSLIFLRDLVYGSQEQNNNEN